MLLLEERRRHKLNNTIWVIAVRNVLTAMLETELSAICRLASVVDVEFAVRSELDCLLDAFVMD